MADEVTINFDFKASKNGILAQLKKQLSLTLSGTAVESAVQDIGFSADEAVVFPVVAIAEGMSCYAIANLDATNYVEISTGTGGSFAGGFVGKIPAQRFCFITTYKSAAGAVTLYAQANTAAVKIGIIAIGPLSN